MHARVHRRHAELVARLEHIEREDRALVGERHLRRAAGLRRHRAGAVEHDEQRDARRVLPVLVLHAHREHLLDGRAVVAADAVAVLATEQREAAAEILHPPAVEVHLLAGEIERGDIAEQEEIELLQVLDRARQPGHAARLDGDLPAAQRLGQRARIGLVGVHEKDARLPAEAGCGLRAVVLRRGVALGDDLDFVGNEAAFRAEIRRAEFVVTGLQRHVARLDQELVLVELHLRGRLHIAAQMRHEIEGLALLQPARHIDALDEHLRRGFVAQRHDRQLYAARREPARDLRGAACRVIAVGEQHETFGFPRGKDRAGEVERAANVRAPAICERGPLLREARAVHRRLPQLGVPGKSHDPRRVPAARVRETRAHKLPRSRARCGREARGIIHRVEHRDVARRQQQPQPG